MRLRRENVREYILHIQQIILLLLFILPSQQKMRSVLVAVAIIITDVGSRLPKILDTSGGQKVPGGRGNS